MAVQESFEKTSVPTVKGAPPVVGGASGHAALRKPNGPRKLFDGPIVKGAVVDAFRKLDPRHQFKNPVMFVVEVGSALTTVLFVQALAGKGEAPAGFILAVSLWLWFTVLFANFAEAMAEGRGKAQAEALRQARKDTPAKKLAEARRDATGRECSAFGR